MNKDNREAALILAVLGLVIIYLIYLVITSLNTIEIYHFIDEGKIYETNNCWVTDDNIAKCITNNEIITVDFYYSID